MKTNHRFRRSFPLLVLALAALAPAALQAHRPDAGTVETVALFDVAALETPESLVIDRSGNVYVSLGFSGEIRKIAPDGTQSTVAVLPIGAPLSFCGPFFNAVGPLTLDTQEKTLYASVLACDPANRGVWRIPLDGGEPSLVATTPLAGLPNGISYRRGWLYVSDTVLGVIWRIPAEGGTAEVWLEHPLLAGDFSDPLHPIPGANGLEIFRNRLYVANSGQATILEIPFEPGGSAGEPRIHAVVPGGFGCDDFAFDVHGSIYCATAPGNTVVRLDPDGSSEVLLTAADGLDIPTAVAFGRTGRDRFNLYITNAAFPIFPSAGRPSLMRLHLGVPGAPPNR